MALGELFPGLVGELAAIGVPIGDGQSDVNWYVDGRRLKRAVSGLPVVDATGLGTGSASWLRALRSLTQWPDSPERGAA